MNTDRISRAQILETLETISQDLDTALLDNVVPKAKRAEILSHAAYIRAMIYDMKAKL